MSPVPLVRLLPPGVTTPPCSFLPSLPMLDMMSLGSSQTDRAGTVFEEFAVRECLPALQVHLDAARRDRDRACCSICWARRTKFSGRWPCLVSSGATSGRFMAA